MAAGILRSLLPPEVAGRTEVRSAGTGAVERAPATVLAVQTCAEHSIDVSTHHASSLSAVLLREADLILGMEPQHLDVARKLAPDSAGRLHLVTEHGATPGGSTAASVWDPVGGTADQYRDTFNRIRSHLLEWVPRIRDAVERREGVR